RPMVLIAVITTNRGQVSRGTCRSMEEHTWSAETQWGRGYGRTLRQAPLRGGGGSLREVRDGVLWRVPRVLVRSEEAAVLHSVCRRGRGHPHHRGQPSRGRRP